VMGEVLYHRSDRIYYLDYLRGFMILLVVLDHSMHGYTRYFAQMWFMQDVERSEVLDVFHLHNDAIMMPFMFFLAGLFVFSSLERRGLLSYIGERFWRLVVPLVFGVLFIAPFMTYDKLLLKEQISEGFFEFWQSIILNFDSYPLDRASSSGFWFLTYLIILTFSSLTLYSIFPFLRSFFKSYASFVLDHPVWGLCSILLVVVLLNTISDFLWGAHFWFVVKPFFGLRKARFMVKAFFFLLGIAFADSGFLKDHSILLRLQKSWILWSSIFCVTITAYIYYILNFMSEGIYSMPIAYYVHEFKVFPDLDVAMSLLYDDGLWIAGRTVLLSVVIVSLSCFYLSFFANFLNKSSKFWVLLTSCSFGIYIFHEPFVTYMNRMLYDVSLWAEFKFLCVFMISLCFSWLITYCLRTYLPLLRRVI
jgi:glucan biosynthesis protein C